MILHCIRRRHARQNSVAPYIVPCLLDCNQFSEIIDRRFAGSISNLRDIRHQSAYGRDINDAAASLCFHVFYGCLGSRKHAGQIGIDDMQEIFAVRMTDIHIFLWI